jgi:hypothetical protein
LEAHFVESGEDEDHDGAKVEDEDQDTKQGIADPL